MLDPFAEILNGYREIVFSPVDPLFGCRLALTESFAESLDHFISVELVSVSTQMDRWGVGRGRTWGRVGVTKVEGNPRDGIRMAPPRLRSFEVARMGS
jgi:hypothetical protein